MKKNYLFILLIILFFSCEIPHDNSLQFPLFSGWEFEYNSEWHEATVPGCIHSDLMNHGFIENPFFRNNEDSVQWVADRHWKYRTHFSKTNINQFNAAEIVLEGLDSYAEIFLNGEPFIHENGSHITNNMFRKWIFPLDMEKLEEENELLIVFAPTKLMDQEKAAEYKYKLQDIRALTRKSPYQSGWDWGPTLITCGIWQPAYIHAWNEVKVVDYQIYQKDIAKSAVVDVETELDFFEDIKVGFDYFIDGILVFSVRPKQYPKGKHIISQELTIKNPLLWYPNGMGEQHMYTVDVAVNTSRTSEKVSRKIGLRTVELKQLEDSIGKSFTFYVNGIPVFMKGTNWIPAESFPVEMSYEKYHKLIKSIKNANMNMVRIWGGGHYENEDFYTLCDEMGILVWQDFMFAGALYPEEKEFHDNILMEVKEQIKKLRHHPSIALWCGNNEVKNAWEDWGWQKEYSEKEQICIGNNIRLIFDTIIANAVQQYDPGRPYHPTSPLWGWGHPESFTEGDSHYWGVWWGELPFEVWEEKTGRFMSEYGFQSYPELASIKQFTIPEDRALHSPVMKNHQKHARGIEIITKSMNQYFGQTDDFEDFIYLSQLVQAYGIGEAIEIHRRKMPYCMGTLYWQLNDCWPVASWSSIDYYGNKKALYYVSAEKFSPLMISTKQISGNETDIWLVSDLLEEVNGTILLELKDLSGNIIDQKKIKNVSLKANTSSHIMTYSLPKIINAKKEELFLLVTFNTPNQNIVRKTHYFVYPKKMELRQPEIALDIKKRDGKFIVYLKANTLVKGLFLHTDDDFGGDYSDNYFDLLPGEEKTIEYTPSDHSLDRVFFNIKSYNGITSLKK